MKKILSAVLCAAMIVTLLCSCSSVPANTVFSADDLWGKTIGTQLGTTGYIYSTDYEKPNDGTADESTSYSTVEGYNSGAEAIQALITGKVDCVIIDNEPAKAYVAANKGIKILDEEFAVEEYAICFAKGGELKDKVNTALATLKANGTLQQIINNYIGDETKGTCPYTSPEGTERTNGTLVMATNAAFPPYEYTSGDSIVGIDADLAQAIADILGMELKIDNMEFTSIFAAVQSGKADMGVAGMTITDERLENVDFSDPYTTATQVIIVREN
ncbi:MAG TPA: transporter substrate-binding domain-containing protein [Bacillota bacterium]|nr:transporter substrate-binding domain-containing protein [Bacillota bacterium]